MACFHRPLSRRGQALRGCRASALPGPTVRACSTPGQESGTQELELQGRKAGHSRHYSPPDLPNSRREFRTWSSPHPSTTSDCLSASLRAIGGYIFLGVVEAEQSVGATVSPLSLSSSGARLRNQFRDQKFASGSSFLRRPEPPNAGIEQAKRSRERHAETHHQE